MTLSATLQASDTRVGNVKMAIIEWTGTEDAVTADPISSWGADGVTPTLAANFAFSNTPANLGVGTSPATFSVTATLGASFTNLCVLIWNDDKVFNAADALYITDVQPERAGLPRLSRSGRSGPNSRFACGTTSPIPPAPFPGAVTW